MPGKWRDNIRQSISHAMWYYGHPRCGNPFRYPDWRHLASSLRHCLPIFLNCFEACAKVQTVLQCALCTPLTTFSREQHFSSLFSFRCFSPTFLSRVLKKSQTSCHFTHIYCQYATLISKDLKKINHNAQCQQN